MIGNVLKQYLLTSSNFIACLSCVNFQCGPLVGLNLTWLCYSIVTTHIYSTHFKLTVTAGEHQWTGSGTPDISAACIGPLAGGLWNDSSCFGTTTRQPKSGRWVWTFFITVDIRRCFKLTCLAPDLVCCMSSAWWSFSGYGQIWTEAQAIEVLDICIYVWQCSNNFRC